MGALKRQIKNKGRFIAFIGILILFIILVVAVAVNIFISFINQNTPAITYVLEDMEELKFTSSSQKILDLSTYQFASLMDNPLIQLERLIDEVLNDSTIKSLPEYKYLSKEFLLGIPCVETAGKMTFEVKNALLDSLTTVPDSVSGAKGLYQIKDEGRWGYKSFNSKYSTAKVDFKRPNPKYTPDAVYSIAYAFAKSEFGATENRFKDNIKDFQRKTGIAFTADQYKEIIQVLGCEAYYCRVEDKYKQSLVDFICYSLNAVTSFKKLSPYASDSFHDSVRKLILGEVTGNGVLPEMKTSLQLTNGEVLRRSLIDYIDELYPESNILDDFRYLYKNYTTTSSTFIDYAYGIGVIACGDYRIQSIMNRFNMYYADVTKEEGYLLALDYCRKNNIHIAKAVLDSTVILEETGVGFDVKYWNQTVDGRTFAMFCFDGGNFEITDTVSFKGKTYTFSKIDSNKRYFASRHILNRGYLANVPSKFVSDDLKYSDLLIDIRVIPALNEMHEAWERYKEKNSIDSDIKVKVISAFRDMDEANELLVYWANELEVLNKDNWTTDEKDIQKLIEVKEAEEYAKDTVVIQFKAMVATPGNSPHHTGRVIDLEETADETYREWLLTNCKAFGFHNYAAERWHYEYNPTLGER